MNEQQKTPTPVWFWVIAVLAILWNLMGCAAFLMEMFAQESMMETMSEEQKEWVRAVPRWVYVVYAFAVLSGVAGSVGLLMRQAWSIPLLALCVFSVIVQMVYTMLIAGGMQVMGLSGLLMPALVIVLSFAILWFSMYARGKGWIHASR